jgi:hypothetical protein
VGEKVESGGKVDGIWIRRICTRKSGSGTVGQEVQLMVEMGT